MKERVRVVRIIDRLNIGGPAKHVTWLTAGMDSDEFETTLIAGTVPPGEGDMSYFASAAGVVPLVIKEMSRELSLRDILVIAKLVRQLIRLKPQIVHTHKAKAGAAGRVAAMIYKWLTPSALWLRPRQCRIAHTYHGHIFHSYYGGAKTKLFVAIERALARLCTDRIIVISQQQRREINETFRVGRPEQFRVVPLGLDLGEMARPEMAISEVARPEMASPRASLPHGSLRRELGISDEETAVGIVGRLCEVKNHAMFLESAARLAAETGESKMPARFVVIGDGHLRADLQRQSRDLGIDDKVSFTGFRKDAASLYSELDLVALTSLNEGTPLTLIEALASGRAVAATEAGGVVDIMGNRRETRDGFAVWDHGVTAPSKDAEAFARALRFMIERPQLRREMGQRGRAFVETRLSKDRLVRDVENVYRELMGGAIAAPSRDGAALIQS